MDKKRMKTICSIFYDAGLGNIRKDRFEEMFEYYWKEINIKTKNKTKSFEEERLKIDRDFEKSLSSLGEIL